MRHSRALICSALLLAACRNEWQASNPNVRAAPAGSTERRPVYGGRVADDVPPPISGGTLRVLADGNTVVASDPDHDTISVVDLSARRVRATIALPAGSEPGRIVGGTNGRVHVVLRRGGGIATIDSATATLVGTTHVCAAPRGIDFNALDHRLYVACTDGTLIALNEADLTVARTVRLMPDLRDVVARGVDTYVSTFRDATIHVVHSDDSVTDVTNTQTGLARVAWRMIPAQSRVLMVHQSASMQTIDVDSLHTAQSLGPEAPAPEGPYSDATGCTPLVGTTVTEFDGTAANTRFAFSNAVLPVDIAVTSSGDRTVVAAAGNASIPTMPQLIEAESTISCDPRGGGGAFSNEPAEQPNAQVVAVAFDGHDRLVAQTREPAAIYLIDEHAVISLPGESRADLGHQIFHSNTGGNIACASCHPEGDDDGNVWRFSDVGERRTQHLAGAMAPRGPYHWRGELAQFDNVVSEIFETRMSGPTLDSTQANALQHYLLSMRRPLAPEPVGAEVDAVARGRAIFERADVGCTACHSGPRFTTDAMVSVGTNGVFKVPSLIGLAAHAPYMHNGCARTLRDRFTSCGGGDLHGHTSQLASSEVDDLIAYLRTL